MKNIHSTIFQYYIYQPVSVSWVWPVDMCTLLAFPVPALYCLYQPVQWSLLPTISAVLQTRAHALSLLCPGSWCRMESAVKHSAELMCNLFFFSPPHS